MADAKQGINLPAQIAGILLAGGTLTALAVFLGRLWTSSYFDYFGLPTSDLTLDAGDYAFRTKEVLLMLLVAVAVAGGITWKAQAIGINARMTSQAWRIVLGVTVAAIALIGWMTVRTWGWIESSWRWLPVGFGVAIGVAFGILLGVLIDVVKGLAKPSTETPAPEGEPRPSSPPRSPALGIVLVSATMIAVLVFVPFLIVGLARARAADDVKTQNLAQAVIEFVDKAPQPISRPDDPKRSTRVYLLLLTPKRIAVAFPYPCTQVTTQQQTSTSVGVCDTLAFDRDQVRSVRVFGKGGGPTNDARDNAELITLDVTGDDLSPRTIYRQGFDFAAARPTTLDCRNQEGVDDAQGVWFRLVAGQAGRVDLLNPDQKSTFYLASPDDPRACRRVDELHGIRLGLREEALLFVTRPTSGEQARGVVELSYAPLAMRANDCRVIAVTERPAQRTVDCNETETLSLNFSVPSPSSVAVAVETSSSDAPDSPTCPADLVAPRVLLSDLELPPGECRAATTEAGRYSILYRAGQPIAGGQWTLAVCAPPGVNTRIHGVTVTSTQLSPEGTNNGASAGQAPGATAAPPATSPPPVTPGDHAPAFACPT